MTIAVTHADMLEWLAAYDGPQFDACVTDPPYHLTSIVKRFGAKDAAEAKDRDGAFKRAARGFMGKTWDGGDIAQRPETWRAVYDALKPGAHLIAFAGTRTFHRMTVAIEDAGFEIRDMLCWHYGSGFPKSHDVSKGIDRHNGDIRPVVGTERLSNDIRGGGLIDAGHGEVRGAFERDVTVAASAASAASAAWGGWGTALKPALEPICLARKPLSEKNIAANVLRYGTGALNIDGCRIDSERATGWAGAGAGAGGVTWNDSNMGLGKDGEARPVDGRWPANVVHDGSDDVIALFPDTASGTLPAETLRGATGGPGGKYGHRAAITGREYAANAGSAARFFYSAKAGPLDRLGSAHATVKPVDLMRWLVRLVTPPGGRVLDPFAGSGTTGVACMAEGFDCRMIELEADHVADIQRKLDYLLGKGGLSVIEKHKAKRQREAKAGALSDAGPLFGSPT